MYYHYIHVVEFGMTRPQIESATSNLKWTQIPLRPRDGSHNMLMIYSYTINNF